MFYDLRNSLDKTKFIERVKFLLNKETCVEMTEKVRRTLNQNSYLYLILGAFSMETGNSIDYTKQNYFKKLCNKDLFVVEREDPFLGKVEVLRSSADLTKEEMSIAIDRFKRWSAENGYYLPSPEDREYLREIEIQMAKMKSYL